jgi:hypothetical protein
MENKISEIQKLKKIHLILSYFLHLIKNKKYINKIKIKIKLDHQSLIMIRKIKNIICIEMFL